MDQVRSAALSATSWYVAAGRRTGKTMLLRRATALLADARATVVYVDAGSLDVSDPGVDFFRRICTDTAHAAGHDAHGSVHALERDITALERDITALATQGHFWCLLIDEAEALATNPSGPSVLDNLRYLASNSPVAETVSIGLAGGLNLPLQLRSSGSSLLNICRPLLLPPLLRAEVADLVSLGVSAEMTERWVDYLWRVAGGHPWLCQMLLAQARDSLSDFDRDMADARREAHGRLADVVQRLDPVLRNGIRRVAAGELVDGRLADQLVAAGLVRRAPDSLEPTPHSLEVNGELVLDIVGPIGNHAVPPALAGRDRHWIRDLIAAGETPCVEFKSSVQWDYKRNSANKELALEIAQAVAGFMNTNGGVLLVGVEPTGKILGLQPDIDANRRNPTLDGLYWSVAELLTSSLGEASAAAVTMGAIPLEEGTILALSVAPSGEPVYVSTMSRPQFFVRVGTTTRSLDVRATVDYVRTHWG